MENKTMHAISISPARAVIDRLEQAYPAAGADWPRYFSAQYERGNFASRYHFVYPALAYFVWIRRDSTVASEIRPALDVMYDGLINEQCWGFWHSELNESTGAIAERNLTYAGSLAMFVGFYIDAFGEPPAQNIEVDGESVSYSELSENLWRQMTESPSCGVSCYNRESMVMCNAVLLINNIIHDRLFGTNFAASNGAWLKTVKTNLTANVDEAPLFYYATQADSSKPNQKKMCLGLDAWAMTLMASVVPEETRAWFAKWRHHIESDCEKSWVTATERESSTELSSTEFTTAWAYCLAAELGEDTLKAQLDAYLAPKAVMGFRVDPYMSGLYLLGQNLERASLHRLVTRNA